MVVMRAEHLHPAAQRMRHAQLLAAAANGPLTRKDKRAFSVTDFMTGDAWALPAPAVTGAVPDVLASVAAINSRISPAPAASARGRRKGGRA